MKMLEHLEVDESGGVMPGSPARSMAGGGATSPGKDTGPMGEGQKKKPTEKPKSFKNARKKPKRKEERRRRKRG